MRPREIQTRIWARLLCDSQHELNVQAGSKRMTPYACYATPSREAYAEVHPDHRGTRVLNLAPLLWPLGPKLSAKGVRRSDDVLREDLDLGKDELASLREAGILG